jgi:hypothetical protein
VKILEHPVIQGGGAVPLLFRVLGPVAETDQYRRAQRDAENHGIAVVLPPGFEPVQIFLFFVSSQDVTLVKFPLNPNKKKLTARTPGTPGTRTIYELFFLATLAVQNHFHFVRLS